MVKIFPSFNQLFSEINSLREGYCEIEVAGKPAQIVSSETWNRESFPGKRINVALHVGGNKYNAIAETYQQAVRRAVSLWELDT